MMSNNPDLYALLGVPRNASQEKIRQAYFSAARRLHPDKNIAPGETEFFLEVQQAYETLSDPNRRANYDATLPVEETNSYPIKQEILFSRQHIVRKDEPQLVYALLTYSPVLDGTATPSPPLNLCLVLDRSTSMKGVSLDVVKATTIQILRRLRPQDVFSIVTFSDRAEVLIPASRDADLSKLEARIQMLQTSGGTEIFQGLEMAYGQIQHNLNRTYINQIILITDGRTYGDEAQCLALADKAAENRIGISGLGIGHSWNDTFLDELAKRTGGNSNYVSNPKDIQRLLLEKMNHLWQVFAEEVTLEFHKSSTVELRYAFRLSPEVGLLPLESPIHLGPIPRDSNLAVLMEFVIPGEVSKAQGITLFDGVLTASVSTLVVPMKPLPVFLTRPVTTKLEDTPPPKDIVQALSKLTLYRMQEQARLEVGVGNYNLASERLKNLANHLLVQGEKGLARTALLEAEHVQSTKAYSQEGDKKIKYGTRALLMSGVEGEK
jgi:Ca-activated chloride channel family protein